MDISIIIINYNTKALTKQCLQSVFEKTRDVDFEIIVVDNASHDGSQAMLKTEFPQVRLIESPENLGFGRANNLGAIYAAGKYLFLLNSDTLLLNNAVEILFDFMEENPNCGICGGNLYDEKMLPAHSFTRNYLSVFYEIDLFFFNKLSGIVYGKNVDFNHSGKNLEVACIVGADLLIRRNVFEQQKGFDPDFFMYHEEQELCSRVKKDGYKIVNVSQSKIIHLEGKSINSNSGKQKMVLLSRNLFYQKTHSKLYHKFTNAIFKFTILSRCIVFKLLGNKEKFEWWLFLLYSNISKTNIT